MGDDIGWMQPSIYHEGLMVGETPNIDRIGHEGSKFMDYVAMQSCTSGRNAFFSERADIARESRELSDNREGELRELAGIVSSAAWRKARIAEQLMARAALGAHGPDELGISEATAARPIQAALASAASFAVRKGREARLRSLRDLDAAALTFSKACALVLDGTVTDGE